MAETHKEKFYLLLDGIKGPVTDPGYEGWLPINSLKLGMGVGISQRRVNPPSNNTKDDEDTEIVGAGDIVVDETEEEAFCRKVKETIPPPTTPSVSEATLRRFVDVVSPLLLFHATQRLPFRQAVIERVFDRTTVRLTLHTAIISGYSVSADDEGYEDVEEYVSDESLSLNFRSFEFHVLDKVRRPLALPKAFSAFDPHRASADGSFPVPLELVVTIFSWLDQRSLVRAAMACKRFAFAASDDQLKVFVAHSTGYNLVDHSVQLQGRTVERFWPLSATEDW